MSQIFRQQCIATREVLRALIAMLDGLLAEMDRPAPELVGCQHPEKERRPSAVMGKPSRWICGACGAIGGLPAEVNNVEAQSKEE